MTEPGTRRKLAAILAADVVGYSRLIGRDEEGTLARLRRLRAELIDPLIATHHGRLVKTTGDGFLVEFASVVDALRCASPHGSAAWRPVTARTPRTASPSASASMSATSSSKATICSAMASTSRRGWRRWPTLAASASPRGVFEDTAGRTDVAFEDAGEQALKNIARPIRVYRARFGDQAVTADHPASPPAMALTLPDKPSLAVLPFQNFGADADQDYLADGLAEDIITALSRYPSLFVIARSSSFSYQDGKRST